MKTIRETVNRLGFTDKLLALLWKRKAWWLVPLVVLVVFLAVIIIAAAVAGDGSFNYNRF